MWTPLSFLSSSLSFVFTSNPIIHLLFIVGYPLLLLTFKTLFDNFFSFVITFFSFFHHLFIWRAPFFLKPWVKGHFLALLDLPYFSPHPQLRLLSNIVYLDTLWILRILRNGSRKVKSSSIYFQENVMSQRAYKQSPTPIK